jgi:hypothetical protein
VNVSAVSDSGACGATVPIVVENVISCTSLLPVVAAVDGRPLTRTEKLVLLAWGANYTAGVDEPVNLDTLAVACLATPSSVAAALRRLADKGLLSLVSTGTTLRVHPGPALVEPGTELPVLPPTAEALHDGLVGVGGVLDGFRADYVNEPVLAYHATLTAAEQLARDFPAVSRDVAGYLRNAVIAAAARDAHDLEGKAVGRLAREAKVLGARGGHHVVAALFATASAAITGDVISYVCRAARRLAQEEGVR